MSGLQATEVAVTGGATPEPAPAPPPTAEKADGKAGGPSAPADAPRGRLPSNDELRAKAFRDFQAAIAKQKAEKCGESPDPKTSTKGDSAGRSGQGGAQHANGKAAPAKADAKAEPKATEKAGDPAGRRDEHGRFVSGEGGTQGAPSKAEKAAAAPTKAESGEAREEAEAAPPKPSTRDVEGRPPGHPDAKITDEQLRDEAELDRRFTALKRESRHATTRLHEANVALQRLEHERATFQREREAAQADPDRLSRRELTELAHGDPIAFLERIGVTPEQFHRSLLTSGTEAARVDRLERQWQAEKADAERREREAAEARKRQEAEQTEAQRRQSAEEREEHWRDIQRLLAASADERPATAKMAAKAPDYVRHRLEAANQAVFREICAKNPGMTPQQIGAALTQDNRRVLFERALERLEDDLADQFGTEAPRVNLGAARGGPTAESGAGPRSGATTAPPPEGTQTLTPRLSSESSPRYAGVVKTQHQLQIEARRAFERALGQRGALPTSKPLGAPRRARGPRSAGLPWRSQTSPHTRLYSRHSFRTTRSSASSIVTARSSRFSRRTRAFTAPT